MALISRSIYTLLWYCALPLLPARLWWRGRSEPGYRQHVGERFGRYAPLAVKRETWWVHAVSVGETRAAAPLIERLSSERPDARIVLTSMTATGRNTALELYGNRVVVAFLPYDVPFAVDRFLAHFMPRAGILLETELWPNIVHRCAERGVPLFLVNARMSERSAAGYARFPSITRPMLGELCGVAAQTSADAARLAALGARDVTVTGNLKFDVEMGLKARELGQAMRARWGKDRAVFVAASTRDGEEALLLDALARDPLPQEAIVVIVPRHPQRFAAVADLLRDRGVPFVRRSEEIEVPREVGVVLGDSMGEMGGYYASCDVAFVGGSLRPLGGQNLIEPIALGVPTLTGPHTFNFADAAQRAVEAQAARRVADAAELVHAVRALLRDPADRAAMAAAAAQFHASHRGATERTWGWLCGKLGLGGSTPASTGPSPGGGD